MSAAVVLPVRFVILLLWEGSSQAVPERWLGWSTASYLVFGYMPWHFRGDPRVSDTMRLVSAHGLSNLGRVARLVKRLLARALLGWGHHDAVAAGYLGWWLGATEATQTLKENWAMSMDAQTWCVARCTLRLASATCVRRATDCCMWGCTCLQPLMDCSRVGACCC